MYQINIEGINHYAEYLNYVRKKPETGCYVQSSKEEATAVVVDNLVCSLPNKEEFENNPVAYITEIDSGEIIRQLVKEKEKLKDELTSTQLALTEIYERG